MEHKPPRPMTPFDDLVTPPQLYTLKLMLPYTPSAMQRMLGVYIKFLEFKNTLEHFHGLESPASSILEGLKNYMTPEEQETMEQMEMMMNMMEMMKNQPDMSDMSDVLGGMFGDVFHAQDSDGQKGDSDNE